MKRLPICVLTTLTLIYSAVAGPALADVYAKTRTSSGGDTPNSQMDMLAEVYAQGEEAQVFFLESSNAFMKEGTYLYTPDAGRTVYLVDPKEETVSEWDIAAMLKFAGAVLDSMGPVLNLEISDPKVDVISEGPGPDMHGLSTREYKIESHYSMLMKILGMKRQQDVREVSTIVVTDGLPEVSVAMWLRNDPPKTGNEQIDKLAESAWERVQEGATVRYRTDSEVTTKKGKVERSWTEFEVVELDRSAGGPPGGYGYPDHYTPVQMMPIAAEQEEDGDKKKKGRFGGLFRDGN